MCRKKIRLRHFLHQICLPTRLSVFGQRIHLNRPFAMATTMVGMMLGVYVAFQVVVQTLEEQVGNTAYSLGTSSSSQTEFSMDFNSTRNVYAVIFDAGSTGSRMHVYHFRKNQDWNVELVHETFQQVKPGLSNYSADPQKGAESLHNMLTSAIGEVPVKLHSETPIVLKATAGLRLLPHGAAENLLNEVSVLFRKTMFHQVERGVEILGGSEEGIFSWVTVNYLEGAFYKSGETVAALDLGGGSTQITFVPKEKRTIESAPHSYLTSTNLFSKNYTLYTHSYLGLGLMSARFRVLGGTENEDDGASTSSETLRSACLPPDREFSWVHHGGKKFNVRGLPESESGYSQCYATVQPLVTSSVATVPELSQQKVYAFSYFFDRAVDSDLIDEVNGGSVLVTDFQEAAQRACDSPDIDDPFLCMDLTYIYSLLHNGYGLSLRSSIHVLKQIKKIEVSWTLGAAFQVLTSIGHL
ncbi:ectonucleoside triphosphate diphosphohydrolase 5-like isoform X1 [Haliotis rufescens]|uniref:ectonucleoside triphosphate diphosphohydrolase 5-like isoform X1 n=1 Tax=Haliotis rufescens TaxID=6454 RepID=UPI00201F510C|nr:ectonucleoside triphosphate diphosphohydrolase 5-like isoform X1 [Haliotis rufescens]